MSLNVRGLAAPERDQQPIVLLADDGAVPHRQLEFLRSRDHEFPGRVPIGSISGQAFPLTRGGGERIGLAACPAAGSCAPHGRRTRELGSRIGSLLEPGQRYWLDLTTGATDGAGPVDAADFVEGLLRAVDHGPKPPSSLTVQVDATDAAGDVERRITVTLGTLLARDLASTPSDVKSPDWLAEQATALADHTLEVTVLDAADLRTHGFGGLLSVSSGSARPGNLTVLRWRNSDDPRGPMAVVGKGITFDSGGLSLKPATGMPLMKTDMAGAAAVLGAFANLRALSAPVDAVGVIACAENMPGGSAMRPGDVTRHYGGRTTEILNTDAEGRLVLADALAYTAREFSPRAMVDIATLTGAATVGLGRSHAPLYCDHEALAHELEVAAGQGGESVWRMPLPVDYRNAIRSHIADAANTNTDPHVGAGSITAALYLQPFASDVPWAHLDIAGTGRSESASPGQPKGATGFGARLLTEWLAHVQEQAYRIQNGGGSG